MDIDLVHPELRPALRRLPSLDSSTRLGRLVGRLGPKLLRAVRVADVTTSVVRDGDLRVRVYRPDRATGGPGLLWVHGGGLVIGAAKQDDRLCAGTAARLAITVASVEYRLAPEAPFPAALDDATAAWQWIAHRGPGLGIDPARVAVGGESAGAGIAASLVQRLHDTTAVQPVAQWLFAPMLDDHTAARTELDAIDHPVWNNRANRFGWAAYLGREPGAADVPPYAVPARRLDLTGLPPTWLCVGDIELFHDEVTAYADRLRAAGVEVQLDVVPGAAHGFENWASSTQLAQHLVSSAQDWLASTLHINISRDAA
ncbi:MAG TPA: alpha/beta hydrolase [Friedmanniella sp.]